MLFIRSCISLLVIANLLCLSACSKLEKSLDGVMAIIGSCGAIAGLQSLSDNQLYATEILTGRLYGIDGNTGQIRIIADHLVTPHGLALYQNDELGLREAYVTEILKGRISKIDLTTGETTEAFPGIDFLFPARLIAVRSNKEFLVTEPLRSAVIRVFYDNVDNTWKREEVKNGILFADGITQLQNGEVIVGSFFLFGSLTGIDPDDLTIKKPIHRGRLALPITILENGWNPSSYYVSESGAARVSLITETCDNTGCSSTRQTVANLAVPTGMAYGYNPGGEKDSIFVADGLLGRIEKITLDQDYGKSIHSVFRCGVAGSD